MKLRFGGLCWWIKIFWLMSGGRFKCLLYIFLVWVDCLNKMMERIGCIVLELYWGLLIVVICFIMLWVKVKMKWLNCFLVISGLRWLLMSMVSCGYIKFGWNGWMWRIGLS